MSTHSKDPMAMIAEIKKQSGGKRPPVHDWNPPFCGDIDMRIARNGRWFYQGGPIGRMPMVKLFASVLRKDEDDCYYLVTPVEKVRIQVEDAPFIATGLEVIEVEGLTALKLITNVDDEVFVGPENPIHVVFNKETLEPSPYVRVRDRLDALISRAVYYQLVNLAELSEQQDQQLLQIKSMGETYILGKMQSE